MNQLSTLRRRLPLIRLVEAPFLYHTKKALVARLQEQDVEAVSERTVERDIAAISQEYGIHIHTGQPLHSCDRRTSIAPARIETAHRTSQ